MNCGIEGGFRHDYGYDEGDACLSGIRGCPRGLGEVRVTPIWLDSSIGPG